jgi:hypothetical protein
MKRPELSRFEQRAQETEPGGDTLGTLSLRDLAQLPRRMADLEAGFARLAESVRTLQGRAEAPLSVRAFCERYGWSENQLRWLLFNRDKNGLSDAVSGRGRLLIDPERFFAILKAQHCGRRSRRS